MYNNTYMRSEPLMAWSDDAKPKEPVPAHLMHFIENYYDEGIEFGFDAHDYAEQILDSLRDENPGLDDVELANLAISNSF